ncbi:MAG TPA: hypothetical protein VKG20_18205, partial [Methylomirabilota bacterium]|nr:hypothetical protein [Methylomirabilota bacterium]
MRALVGLVFVVIAAACVAAADTMAVLVFQDGRPNALALEDQQKVGRLAVEMLASASYEASSAVAEQAWLDARLRPHLYVTFMPPRAVRFPFSTTGPATEQEVQVAEMMVRIVGEWPEHIMVREQGRTRAFAKYGQR